MVNEASPSSAESFVLLVEDNADDEYLLRRSYTKAQLKPELVAVDDGAQAIDLVITHQQIPKVVLLDLHLPRVDGDVVLAQLRGHPATRQVPVIVLISADEDVTRIRALGFERVGFVRKPARMRDLCSVLAELNAADGVSAPS